MLAERLSFWVNSQQTTDPIIAWDGGISSFTAYASAFSAATVTLNWIGPDGTVLAVGSSTTVTANAFVTPLYLPAGKYSVTVTGGSPTGLYVFLDRIPQ